jgi:hypothetical protein
MAMRVHCRACLAPRLWHDLRVNLAADALVLRLLAEVEASLEWLAAMSKP